MELALRCILLTWVVTGMATCESESDDDDNGDNGALFQPITSDLYGPCGTKEAVCADGLSCVPSAADAAVFICTRACVPSPKCVGAIAVGQCRAMLECGQGCCQINNLWGDSSVTLECDDAESIALLSDGFCQPWP